MLLTKHRFVCPAKLSTSYCLPATLKARAHSSPCTAGFALEPEVTPAVTPSRAQPVVPSQHSRVLFVGGLPGAVDASILQQQLAAACAQWQPTRVEVARFEQDAVRSRFAAGWQHKGHAAIAFTSEAVLGAAAAAVRRLAADDWGVAAVVGPARSAPPHWPLELTLTPQELEELQQQQAAAALRRAHNKRQRDRRQQRLIGSVASLLASLAPPAGMHAAQQYQPLLGSQLQQHCQLPLGLNSQSPLTSSSTCGSSSSSSSSGSRTGQAHLLDQLLAAMPDPLRSAVRVEQLQLLLQTQQQQQQQSGLIRLAAAPSVAVVEQKLLLDWSRLPGVVDPAFGGQLADADVVRAGAGRMNLRALRKRVQVESFVLLLLQLALPALSSNAPLHVVEFGSGSGNLVLPLAYLFPSFTFTAVDMKANAVQLLRQRVQQGLLRNVKVQEGTIELYQGSADVVLALHACGAATDWSLAQAASRSAAFIVSPCCIGKINKNNAAGLLYKQEGDEQQQAVQVAAVQLQQALQQAGQIQYPRSQWLTQQMDALAAKVEAAQQQQTSASSPGAPAADTPEQPLNQLQQAVLLAGSRRQQCQALFSLMAQAADYSHQERHSYPDLAALAKSNVELDRGLSMAEAGYSTALVRLLQPELTAKSDVLVGLPVQVGVLGGAAAAGGGAESLLIWPWT